MGALSRCALAILVPLTYIGSALGSAPPVGPLPPGPTKHLTVHVHRTFDVVLTKSPVAGRVWRVARASDGKVVTQSAERETSRSVVVRFRAWRTGSTRIVFALTLGERAHAYAA